MSLERRRTLMKSFIESQFGYCPLAWMFCGRKSKNRITYLHERALRIVYTDSQSSFENTRSVSIHHGNICSFAIEIYKMTSIVNKQLQYIYCPTSHEAKATRQ